jgi:hypothetical protein
LINPLIKVVVNPLSVTRIELNTKDGAIEIPQILLLWEGLIVLVGCSCIFEELAKCVKSPLFRKFCTDCSLVSGEPFEGRRAKQKTVAAKRAKAT